MYKEHTHTYVFRDFDLTLLSVVENIQDRKIRKSDIIERPRWSRRQNDNLQGLRATLVDGDTSKESFVRWSGPRGSCTESVNLANTT